jgi:hypothetical protein
MAYYTTQISGDDNYSKTMMYISRNKLAQHSNAEIHKFTHKKAKCWMAILQWKLLVHKINITRAIFHEK